MTRRGTTTVVRIAALVLLGLLHATWLLADIPWTVKAGVSGLLLLALVRPGEALLVWAGLAPFATSIATLSDASVSGGALLEAMTLAVVAGAVVHHAGSPATRLALPALWMSSVAVASALAELPARLVTSMPDSSSPLGIAHLLFRHAVDRSPALDPWYVALLVAEGAALAWAVESIVRRQPALTMRAVWFALLGHAGVGVLNINRIIGASLRGGDFPASLPGIFLQAREHTQYDVNAAASIFAVVALASFGLIARRGWLLSALATGTVLTALWIAGSRVAIVALLVTTAAVLALDVRRSRRHLMAAGAGVAVSLGIIAWFAVAYPAGRNMNVPRSIASRQVLAETALAMAAEAPVFGIGAGTFLDESPNYGATRLGPIIGRTKDQAHNYFLQTFAEQGTLGLVALLAMLTAALWPGVRGGLGGNTLAKWLAAGIVASVLTWLSGHPLLVPQAALVFWLFIGLLAGTREAPTVTAAWRRFVVIAALAIMASVPFRAMAEERAATLEHLGVGVSQWQPAVDGERYREAGAEFSLYLPSGTTVTLPVRSATAAELNIELRHGSQLFDTIRTLPGVWQAFRLRVPESSSRYLKIDFHVVSGGSGSPPCQPCVWIGKAVPLLPR